MRSILHFICSALLLLTFAAAQDTAPRDMKNRGHDTKQAAKNTGHAAKKTTKDTTHRAAQKTKQGAKKVEDKTAPPQ
jgi:hypothetical protein